MELLNKRKYCLIGLDNIEEIQKDLEFMCEEIVNFATGESLIIATFKSELNIIEIEHMLNVEQRAYIVFEMLPATFSANLIAENFQKALFGGVIDNSEFEPLFNVRNNMENIINTTMDIDNIVDTKPTIDELLDKINSVGLDKLSKTENQYLKEYSKQQ